MTSTNFKDHFSSGSAGYAAYRPSYPLELIDELTSISPGTGRVLDCGCGTGQLSVLLAERFDEVLATDASATQIAAAEPREGVIYRAALAEDSGLAENSVDLITVAQAAHWLDLERFYAEARRIARPQAAIALITYGVLHLEGELDRHLQQFYYHDIAAYWPPERRHVETGYRDLPFPFAEIEVPPQVIEMQWNLAQLIGYLNTWSAVKAAQQALGFNPVDTLAQQLAEEWGDPTTRRRITWPLTIRAGRLRD
ncbi:class I SAM-dependent methyltransferase [Pseudomonas sp. Marseille-P9899]|uniref:class I SAM-dependent methyltransferase n=1 Tax=Pseudomonas sp. Marseille-P9899 TaxID=2730401 RepID=UPI0015889069|nr:class I SAM-dependent methyltransferase [Pseudomonas sp. Marseille-P9899]